MWPIPGPDKSCYEGSVTMLEYLYALNLESVDYLAQLCPHMSFGWTFQSSRYTIYVNKAAQHVKTKYISALMQM